MLDLTKEINLDNKSYSLYRKLQLALYLLAFIFAAYFSYLILFPRKIYTFSFLNPQSKDNNLSVPHLSDGAASSGKISESDNLIFSTVLPNEYSTVKVDLTLNGNSAPANISLSVRKAYQAFLYKEGDPIGFKDGALLKNNGKYFIVSNGNLRKFSDLKIASEMGYPVENFREASDDELKYNLLGANINRGDSFPDATLFKIGDHYYILEDQKLARFSSEGAFLSQYETEQIIEKSEDFLKNYAPSDKILGYADGALVSSGLSAYIISSGKIYPIDNAETFLNKGFAWEDVIQASEDEISLYEKTRLFNIKDPHPDGTVFKTKEDSKYYMVKDEKKHLLPGGVIAESWLKKSPVSVSRVSLETKLECEFSKNSFFSGGYSCLIPLDDFKNLAGSDYEYNLTSGDKLSINSITVDYEKNINSNNLKISLLGIFNKIKLNYGIQIPLQ